MTTDRSPSEVIAALEVALEAGPTATSAWFAKGSEVWIGQRRICSHVTAGESMGMGPAVERERVNAAFIAAANPLAIRTLLDAHASALRDAEELRKALARVVDTDWAFLGRDADTGNPDSLYNRVRDGRKALGGY